MIIFKNATSHFVSLDKEDMMQISAQLNQDYIPKLNIPFFLEEILPKMQISKYHNF